MQSYMLDRQDLACLGNAIEEDGFRMEVKKRERRLSGLRCNRALICFLIEQKPLIGRIFVLMYGVTVLMYGVNFITYGLNVYM